MRTTRVTDLGFAPPGGIDLLTQMVKYLSQGNFGVVWMAKDIQTNELFVMKLPLRRKDIALFLHEVELHRSLDSSFIVAFVESFELQEAWPVRIPLPSNSGAPWISTTIHHSRK